jgi:hypothetical protein
MPHARRATPCSSEARVGGDRHPPGHLRLLHNPADDGSGVPAHRPRPLRRGCRPGPRRLLAPGRPDRSRRGTGRVLPRRPQHPGGKLGERSEGRRHRTARHAPDDERRRYRAHQGRGGAGVGPGARLRRHAASLQAGERRQPTPRWQRSRYRGGHRRLRRGGDAPLRCRPRPSRRADAGVGLQQWRRAPGRYVEATRPAARGRFRPRLA